MLYFFLLFLLAYIGSRQTRQVEEALAQLHAAVQLVVKNGCSSALVHLLLLANLDLALCLAIFLGYLVGWGCRHCPQQPETQLRFCAKLEFVLRESLRTVSLNLRREVVSARQWSQALMVVCGALPAFLR